jgi:hypothetical protein
MKNLKLILITLCIFASVLTYATSYTVSSISYVPYPCTGGTSLTLGDDVNSAPIPLGFSFQFFDQTHTSVIINSNAVLAFGNYSAFRYTPGTNFREVYVNMHDIHPGLASHPGNINYYTLGTAPNRIIENLSGNYVIVGNFTSYQGVLQNRLVEVNSTTGAKTALFGTGSNLQLNDIKQDSLGNYYIVAQVSPTFNGTGL